MKQKRFIIAAGGTGGHFYPGFALAENLKSRGFDLLFFVRENDISLIKLKKCAFPYLEVPAKPLPRRLLPSAHFKFWHYFFKAFSLVSKAISDCKPAGVLGTGSYIGATSVFAAYRCGIPAFVHESNSVPGIGNRLAMPFAKKIMLGLPLKGGIWREKTVLTGTPIREEFGRQISKQIARQKLGLNADKFTVLAFGGSQGASRLNAALPSIFMALQDKIQFIHITGSKNYDSVFASYKSHKLQAKRGLLLYAYMEDMPLVYAASDIVLCRAGASTLAELIQLEKPAILVPLLKAAGNHQYYNARQLDRSGACICLEETALFCRELELILTALVSGRKSISQMQEKYKSIKIPKGLNSAQIAAEIIEKNI